MKLIRTGENVADIYLYEGLERYNPLEVGEILGSGSHGLGGVLGKNPYALLS